MIYSTQMTDTVQHETSHTLNESHLFWLFLLLNTNFDRKLSRAVLSAVQCRSSTLTQRESD